MKYKFSNLTVKLLTVGAEVIICIHFRIFQGSISDHCEQDNLQISHKTETPNWCRYVRFSLWTYLNKHCRIKQAIVLTWKQFNCYSVCRLVLFKLHVLFTLRQRLFETPSHACTVNVYSVCMHVFKWSEVKWCDIS